MGSGFHVPRPHATTQDSEKAFAIGWDPGRLSSAGR